MQIEIFLWETDTLFPTPLSEKQDIHSFAVKLFNNATLCVEYENDRIIAMVAGYTDKVIEGMAYISIVATLPEMQGKGLASKLVNDFIDISRSKKCSVVHLYAVPTNMPAMAMYRKLGFTEWQCPDESRPHDVHLIYNIRKEGVQ